MAQDRTVAPSVRIGVDWAIITTTDMNLPTLSNLRVACIDPHVEDVKGNLLSHKERREQIDCLTIWQGDGSGIRPPRLCEEIDECREISMWRTRNNATLPNEFTTSQVSLAAMTVVVAARIVADSAISLDWRFSVPSQNSEAKLTPDP